MGDLFVVEFIWVFFINGVDNLVDEERFNGGGLN